MLRIPNSRSQKEAPGVDPGASACSYAAAKPYLVSPTNGRLLPLVLRDGLFKDVDSGIEILL